jgi:hypothetical protein
LPDDNSRDAPRVDSDALNPVWDRVGKRLSFVQRELRHYDRVAPQQFDVLDAFQSAGWPEEGIPLPDGMGPSQAKNAVSQLNKGLAGSTLRFELLSNGGTRLLKWFITPV